MRKMIDQFFSEAVDDFFETCCYRRPKEDNNIIYMCYLEDDPRFLGLSYDEFIEIQLYYNKTIIEIWHFLNTIKWTSLKHGLWKLLVFWQSERLKIRALMSLMLPIQWTLLNMTMAIQNSFFMTLLVENIVGSSMKTKKKNSITYIDQDHLPSVIPATHRNIYTS